jgi:hypothetical protein
MSQITPYNVPTLRHSGQIGIVHLYGKSLKTNHSINNNQNNENNKDLILGI